MTCGWRVMLVAITAATLLLESVAGSGYFLALDCPQWAVMRAAPELLVGHSRATFRGDRRWPNEPLPLVDSRGPRTPASSAKVVTPTDQC